MKKILISGIVVSTSIAFANEYRTIIKNNNAYIVKEPSVFVATTSDPVCGLTTPLENEIYKDTTFTQTHSECKQEEIDQFGNKRWINISDITEQKIGTLVLNTCKEIVEKGYSTGSKEYVLTSGLTYCDMNYADGSGYSKIQLYKNDIALMGGCTGWSGKAAKFCSNYTDSLSFNLNKEQYAYVEFETSNWSGSPCNSNTSVISVSDVNVTYHLASLVKHKANLSHNSNGGKSMVIRFSHDATDSGCDNNMNVQNIFLYQQ